jgi:hypothetical protein
MRHLRLLGLALLLLALGTCDGPPQPGWLNLRLVSPNGDDAGVLLTVNGGPIDSVRSSFLEFYSAQQGTSWRMLVAGTPVSGVIAQIWVPNPGAASMYSATVDQVAQSGSHAQRATAGYTLQIAR